MDSQSFRPSKPLVTRRKKSRLSRMTERGHDPHRLQFESLESRYLFSAAPMSSAFSGDFADMGSLGLTDVASSSVAWGDYDNDGRLDILLTGQAQDNAVVAKVYHNEGNGTFRDISAGLAGVQLSSAAWGDYDNDGLLDILLTGQTYASGNVALVYHNDGDGTFHDISAGLSGVAYGSAAWGDYDSDGRLDILLSGAAGGADCATKIYRNDGGGAFHEISTPFTGIDFGSATWGDYDNDGLLDVFVVGEDYQLSPVAAIYHNDGGGTFHEISSSVAPVTFASAAWGDYNYDGRLDLLVAGQDASGLSVMSIYRNDGGGVFHDINAGLSGAAQSSVAWGDYDNDGRLDILVAGDEGNNQIRSRVYHNDGGGAFHDIIAGISPAVLSSVAWGDYNGDGRLDILVTGSPDGSVPSTRIYQNTSVAANSSPGAPGGLTATALSPTSVRLSWTPAFDAQTPTNGLSYNLRVGSTPGGSDIVAPMSDTSSGLRHIAQRGMTQGTTWTLNGLTPGQDYYWSVQAIDAGLAGSPFAPEWAPLSLAIGDATLAEGDIGTTTFDFTVSISGENSQGVTVNYTTSDGIAQAGVDYVAKSGALTWLPGDTSPQTISVTVNGDTTLEQDETFYVTLNGASGAVIFDDSGLGTILNDDLPPANRPPVAEAGGPYTVAEGGTVSLDASGTTDPDLPGDTLTYQWDLDGDGNFGETGAAAAQGDEVGIAPVFAAAGLDGPGTWTVNLQVTDSGGLSSIDGATINLTNLAPHATIGNSGPVDEGTAATISLTAADDPSTADQSAGLHYSFALDQAGLAGTYAAAGTTASTTFTFINEGLFPVWGRVLDKDGGITDYQTNVTVLNAPPTGLMLSANAIAENQSPTTVVGSFTSTDPGAADTFSYSLAAGAGDTDNAAFTIDGAGNLRTAASFDYETKSSYAIRVRTTDSGGLPYEKPFTVAVIDLNEAPTDAVLSNASVAENQPAGALVGPLDTIDPDAGNTFSYLLVAGSGGDDNASFAISGTALVTNASFNYEAKNAYTVRVRATDQGGLYVEKSFAVSVADVNEAPSNLFLLNATVAENQPSGTLVGMLSATDPDPGNTFTYALVAGSGGDDNGSFAVNGNVLVTAASFNYEAKSAYSVRVRATDQGGLYLEKSVRISVGDVNERPSLVLLNPVTSLPENTVTTPRIKIADISVVDDALGTNQLSLSGADAPLFEIDAGVLYLKAGAALDYETNPVLDVTVAVNDPTVGSTPDDAKSLAINVTYVSATGADMPGLYVPGNSAFYLRDQQSGGDANHMFVYGVAGAGWKEFMGDWNGDGIDTPGMYDPATATFYLSDRLEGGDATYVFNFGIGGLNWTPLVGDWNGDGRDSIAVYEPATSLFFFKNALTGGDADEAVQFGVGSLGWIPIAGDWDGIASNGDGFGFYEPSISAFWLKNARTSGPAEEMFQFGMGSLGWTVLAGNWDGTPGDGVGFYVPDTAQWFLKNAHAPGPADTSFVYGIGGAGWRPLVGRWTSTPAAAAPVAAETNPAGTLAAAPAPAASAVDRLDLAALAADQLQPSIDNHDFDSLFGTPSDRWRRTGGRA